MKEMKINPIVCTIPKPDQPDIVLMEKNLSKVFFINDEGVVFQSNLSFEKDIHHITLVKRKINSSKFKFERTRNTTILV